MKPTARELLDTIKKHEEFLNDLEWSREDDSLVFMLAARVEKVLAQHDGAYDKSPCHDQRPGVYCVGCGDPWPCPTVRILNGEEP